MSLDDILARLNELERLSRPTTRPETGSASAAPEPERIQSLPENQATGTPLEGRADEQLVTSSGAADASEQSANAAQRRQSAPPSVPRAPADVDSRYGRALHRPGWPHRDSSGTYGIVFGHRLHDKRPEPVDISAAAQEDVVLSEPEMKQTKQLDFKTIAMSAVYLALVILAIAVAMYIYSST